MKLRFLLLLLPALFAPAVLASSGHTVRNWTAGTPGVEPAKAPIDPSGVIVLNSGDESVVAVLRDSQPGLKQGPYVLRGEVSYAKVGGTGYLEMWNVFPSQRQGEPEERYFSRTLGEFGLMQRLQGNSAWREFILPFNPQGAAAAPVSLELNVVLPDGGIVWLRNLRLTQSEDATEFSWLNRRSAPGVVGGILGALIGVVGGTIGTCIQKRKGRAIALVGLVVFLGIGIFSAIGLVWALTTRNWSWVVSFGVPAAIVFGLFGRFRAQMTNRFDAAELRRMQAADA